MIPIEYGYGSHTGLKRTNNEDACGIAPELGLWIVADGMGGHQAGDVASSMVIRELSRLVSGGSTMSGAIRLVHHLIQSAAARGEGGSDMGSTVVAAKFDGNRYEVAWVGDSRAYLWDGSLHQLTKDHSYVQLLVDAGLIQPSEMATHPNRNIISQALGGQDKDELQVDTVTGELQHGQALLLCSDGLSGEVPDEVIADVLAEESDNQARADRLIEAALAAGGKDNVTVIVLSRT